MSVRPQRVARAFLAAEDAHTLPPRILRMRSAEGREGRGRHVRSKSKCMGCIEVEHEDAGGGMVSVRVERERDRCANSFYCSRECALCEYVRFR